MIQLAFDSSIYRRFNPDLLEMAEYELFSHYVNYGMDEGRIASQVTSRNKFCSLLSGAKRILELGPFASPLLPNDNRVDYFDVLTREELMARADSLSLPTNLIPHIKWVSPTASLEIVDKGIYDVCVSCHVIEHQTCLVSHINQVMSIVGAEGAYLLAIPDYRFIFDQALPQSRVSEVIDAYYRASSVHTLAAVIDDAFYTVHNDWVRHWDGDHATPSKGIGKIISAINKWKEGGYIDVHAWRFSPASFVEVFHILNEIGLFTPSLKAVVYPTIRGSHEFYAEIRAG